MSDNRQQGASNWFQKCAPCFTGGDGREGDVEASSGRGVWKDDNPNLWAYMGLARHGRNTFSWAIAKSTPNRPILSKIRIELLEKEGLYVGLFDSHGSDAAALNVDSTIEDDLKQAFRTTEDNWLQHVRKEFGHAPLIAAAGTSSLVGIIGGGQVFWASVGDSKALVGEYEQSNIPMFHVLNRVDNVNISTVKAEFELEHPEPDLLTLDGNGVYLIKGRTQLSKSLGDAYLKRPEFNLDNYTDYQLNSTITNPALSATPSTGISVIQENHQFVIFGSNQLWDVLTTSKVVSIVQKNPPKDVAAMVIRSALEIIASKNNMTYSELQNVGDGSMYYNDIAVVVVLFGKAVTKTEEGTITDIGSSSAETDSKGKHIASSQDSKDKSIVSNQDSKGKNIASSQGEGDVVVSSDELVAEQEAAAAALDELVAEEEAAAAAAALDELVAEEEAALDALVAEEEAAAAALDELVAEEEEAALEGGDPAASLSGGGGNVASSSGGGGDVAS